MGKFALLTYISVTGAGIAVHTYPCERLPVRVAVARVALRQCLRLRRARPSLSVTTLRRVRLSLSVTISEFRLREFIVLIIGNSKSNHLGIQGTFKGALSA